MTAVCFFFSTRLDPVLMPERNTIAPPRWVLPLGFFLLDSRGARCVDCAGMLLTKKDRQWFVGFMHLLVHIDDGETMLRR